MDWTDDHDALMSKILGKPQHRHDCENCAYKGSIGKFDVYVCPKAGYDSLIARYGEDADYASMPRRAFADMVAEHIKGNVGDARGGLIENPKLPHWAMVILRVLFTGTE